MKLTERQNRIKKIVLNDTLEKLKMRNFYAFECDFNRYIVKIENGFFEAFVTYKNKCLQHRYFNNVEDFWDWYEPEIELLAEQKY